MAQVRLDSNLPMLNLQGFDPSFRVNLRYSAHPYWKTNGDFAVTTSVSLGKEGDFHPAALLAAKSLPFLHIVGNEQVLCVERDCLQWNGPCG